jgi:tetratricopeptide (TPR) repeat protein
LNCAQGSGETIDKMNAEAEQEITINAAQQYSDAAGEEAKAKAVADAEAKNEEGRALIQGYFFIFNKTSFERSFDVNKCFMDPAKDYAAALDRYSAAIDLNPEPRYFNNRALCNLRLRKYDDAVLDATRAMQGLDSESEAYGKALHRRLLAYSEQGKQFSANLDGVCYLSKASHYKPHASDRAEIEKILQAGTLPS